MECGSILLSKRMQRGTGKKEYKVSGNRNPFSERFWSKSEEKLGKAGRLGKPRAFHFDASSFLSLGGEGVKNPMFLKLWSSVSSDTPTIKTIA